MWKASSMVFILKVRNPLEGDDECIPSNSIVGTRCLFGGSIPPRGLTELSSRRGKLLLRFTRSAKVTKKGRQ